MKRFLIAVQIALFIAFNFFLFTAGLDFFGTKSLSSALNGTIPVYNGREDYDPSLQRLNSLATLEKYCDSIYATKAEAGNKFSFQEIYPKIVVTAVRNRFFQGYSAFGLNRNYMAVLFEPLTGTHASAIVLPEDILKFPYAACSQQSIVVMNILSKKGFDSRVVGFSGKMSGHFSFETYYDGQWHFFDPNMEPNQQVLEKYGQPSIDFLAANPSILLAAYAHMPKAKVLDIFTHYTIGQPNAVIARWATIYQKVTQFLTYTLWIFFLLALILVRKKYHAVSSLHYVRNNRIHLPLAKQGTSPVYYPNYSAQGA